MAPRPAPRRVAVVPHTHWDREWYAPFQSFRLRLVAVLDRLLPLLESDPAYRHFLLDGQLALVDDYLEVRPEAAPRIRALAERGRLSMGPWYVLMDEFLVSPETIIRNLEAGRHRAADFGGAMRVGYLPDMFGHIAQMPQLLRLGGMDDAVVWRGVPASVDRTAFWWTGPDGSTVRAQYLPVGYANGASVPRDPVAFLRRIADHDAELGAMLPEGEAMLWMNGTDHQPPQPWLGTVVEAANAMQEDFRFDVTSLQQYLADASRDGLPYVQGELRSGARASVLMGVLSNRVDVRQAAVRTALALEQRAEPLSALYLASEAWPDTLLEVAWREVLRNAAHDSVCACSHDDVVRAVLHRYAEARAIGKGLGDRAVDALVTSLAEPGAVVVNPAARPRGGVVEIVVPGELAPVAAGEEPTSYQVLQVRPTVLLETRLKGSELAGILGQIRSQQFGDPDEGGAFINAVDVVDRPDGRGFDLIGHAESVLRESLLVDEMKRELYARAKVQPDADVRVRVEQPPSVRTLVRVDGVPGFGWKRWDGTPSAVAPVRVVDRGSGTMPMFDNGLVRVILDPTTGLFSLAAADGSLHAAGLGRLVDDGDHGDTYNWSPPRSDLVVDAPEIVSVVGPEERGPLRARVLVRSRYVLPSHVDEATSARVGTVDVAVTTELELRAGEPFVRVTTTIDNRARDHRLRVWLPLPSPAAESEAECAFASVRRGLAAEGGPTEHPLPTFPSRRWVRAGGLTVAHEGLHEYELVDIAVADGVGAARALALTLLRCTGMLSRVEMLTRPLPAGPPDPLEGPQLQQPVTVRYAVGVGDIDPYAMADDLLLPLEVRSGLGGGTRPSVGTELDVLGAEVSSVRRVGDAVEVRVWNPSQTPTVATVGAGWTGAVVDFEGNQIAPCNGRLPLEPWQIATLRLWR